MQATERIEKQVWVGNIPDWYGIDDVKQAVFDNKFGMPCYVKLERGPHDTKYAILTFRTVDHARELRSLAGVEDALVWTGGRYAVIRRSKGKVHCAENVTCDD